MKVVSVAGYKNSGKTSLVESLLNAFPEDISVATVKSLHHDIEFDTPGTDTHRHRSAGADTVIGVTPTETAEFRMQGKEDGVSVMEQLELLENRSVDWVIVEGFKGANLPTIAVGDIEQSEVGGPILFRVSDGTSIEGKTVFERIESVEDWTGPRGE